MALIAPGLPSCLLLPSSSTSPRPSPFRRPSSSPTRCASSPANHGAAVSRPGGGGGDGGEGLLITTLGRGGSGKTSCAVALARHYAQSGRRTLFAAFGPSDDTAEHMLGSELCLDGPSESDLGGGLSGWRILGTRLLRGPLAAVLAADVRFGPTGPAGGSLLQELAPEEVPMFPGLDGLLALAALRAQLVRGRFDAIVLDGPPGHEAVRLLGSPERALWALRRARGLLGRTDAGRVGLPAVSPVVEYVVEALRGKGGPFDLMGPPSTSHSHSPSATSIWDEVDEYVARAAASLLNPKRFTAYLVHDYSYSDPSASVTATRRLWGGAAHAGAHVGGALLLGLGGRPASGAARETVTSGPAEQQQQQLQQQQQPFEPLPGHALPGGGGGWRAIQAALPPVEALEAGSASPAIPPPVLLDPASATVALFMPGYGQGQVKLSLSSSRGDLLVEAGDQRRSVALPPGMQKGVAGAKFVGDSLVVALKTS